MKNDVKNEVQIYEYPRVESIALSSADIIQIIEEHLSTFVKKFEDNNNFYNGINRPFQHSRDIEAPSNEINVPYARLLTSTVKGYMYKPGLIRYSSIDNEAEFEKIQDIYQKNNEPLENSELGEHQSKYGIGFELLYMGMDNTGTAIPKFTTINPKEIIPVFDYTIERNLIAAIRYYEIDSNTYDDEAPIEYKVEVYYNDVIESYTLRKEYVETNGKKELKTSLIDGGAVENIFFQIPLILYPNNNEYLADYETVRGLIVEYDKLFSDSANEQDRFAAAYLILKNVILAGDDEESRRKLERLKRMRTFEIDENGEITFLTKEIPVEFFKETRISVIDEIHKQTTIPNFQDDTFGTTSGIAIRFKLTNFENTAADKESLFRVGLQKRLDFMKRFLSIKQGVIEDFNIIIKFNRNLPDDIVEKVNIINILKNSGLKITDETLLSLLPFIDNVQDEIDKFDEEEEKRAEKFDVEPIEDEEEEGEKKQKENDNEE
jgi:SPP1 family phage portal protein